MKGTLMTETPSLVAARDAARDVRKLYEILEERLNGETWSLHELMLGFSNDVGYIGRLILAHDGTWDIDGDPRAQLQHKLAESVWWAFVLADELGIDLDQAYRDTLAKIRSGLETAVARTSDSA
jgi:NTP pyrophosphatase (non-canonical NTP hydrolase)